MVTVAELKALVARVTKETHERGTSLRLGSKWETPDEITNDGSDTVDRKRGHIDYLVVKTHFR